MTGLRVRVATPADAGVVVDLLRVASTARPASPWGSEFPDVVRDLPDGLVHLGTIGGRLAGMFVLRWSDEKVWGPDDADAGYLHRLATHPDFAGQGIGATLIAAAEDLIAARGRRWLRLDCDRDNRGLRGYYESLGFSYRGDVTDVPRQSTSGYRAASRYQRPVVVSAPGSCSAREAGTGRAEGGTGSGRARI